MSENTAKNLDDVQEHEDTVNEREAAEDTMEETSDILQKKVEKNMELLHELLEEILEDMGGHEKAAFLLFTVAETVDDGTRTGVATNSMVHGNGKILVESIAHFMDEIKAGRVENHHAVGVMHAGLKLHELHEDPISFVINKLRGLQGKGIGIKALSEDVDEHDCDNCDISGECPIEDAVRAEKAKREAKMTEAAKTNGGVAMGPATFVVDEDDPTPEPEPEPEATEAE